MYRLAEYDIIVSNCCYLGKFIKSVVSVRVEITCHSMLYNLSYAANAVWVSYFRCLQVKNISVDSSTVT